MIYALSVFLFLYTTGWGRGGASGCVLTPLPHLQVKGCFVLTPKVLTKAKERMIVMHPLPRVDEIR